MKNLQHSVRRFLREVESSPAKAVDSDELSELRRASEQDGSGQYVAPAIPVADDTWQVRSILSAVETDAEGDEIEIGMPITILGWRFTLLALGQLGGVPTPGLILPPAEAIDVKITTNRKEQYTATTTQNQQKPSVVNYCNLPLLNDDRRLTNIRLMEASPILTVSWRWAVDLSVVALMGWSDVQITLGYFAEFPHRHHGKECC